MKKLLFLSTLLLSAFWSISSAAASYKDVPASSIYKEGADYLELLGALDDNTYFYPEKLLSKAEFYKILFRVFETTPPSQKSSFADVPQDAWFAPYARWAQNNGMESGQTFGPSFKMSKVEAMEKLLGAYGISSGIFPSNERKKLFSDVPITHPHYPVIARLVYEGILTTDVHSTLDPFQKLTRGDFANLLLEFETWQIHKQEVEASHFYKSDIFAAIWNEIFSIFYLPDGQEIDPDALFNAAIKGMLSSLNDPFTVYFTPEQSTEFTETLNGSFEGIGAYVDQDTINGTFFFGGFVPGSPAAESELQEGDIIRKIDNVSTTALTLSQVMDRIKGAAGTTVLLTIERDEQFLEFRLTRAKIKITTVTGKILEKDSWYIDIDIFGSGTTQDYLDVVETLKKSVADPKAIVLDLRNNGGGIITSANQITGDYLPAFINLVTLDYGDADESIVNAVDGRFIGTPLYILVNERTASASEIMTQDLKEAADATVIGTQTYGKGSAQTLTQFWDGSELKITIAHWLSTKGTSIHGVGVTPNVTIQMDAESGVDPWLEAATKRIEKL